MISLRQNVRRWLLVLCAAFLCSLPAHAATPQDISAAYVDSLIKVFPDTPVVASQKPLTIVSARNAHASLELALRAASNQRITVRVMAPKLAASALRVQAFRVGYVQVKSHPKETPADELVRSEVGAYPDPLFPLSGEIELQRARTETIWLSVYTPRDAKVGIYSGVVEIKAGHQRLKLPFRVRVFGATVPQEQKLWVTNWLWFDHDAMEKQYPRLKGDPERYWKVLENIGRTMAAYKQNAIFVPVRTLARAQLVNGTLRYDFADVDRWIETFDRAGMARMIEGGHLCGRKDGDYNGTVVMGTDLIENGHLLHQELPADDPRAEQNLREFLHQLREHLKEKGWLPRYVQHVHDEPHGKEMPIYRRLVQIVGEQMPGVPTIDAISLTENIPDQQGTTVWVPKLSTFDDQLKAISEHQATGGQAWFYICLDPVGRYLNRFIDYPMLKVRLLPWVDFRYGLTGYLHWGGNFWTDHPFDDVQPNWGGDFYLPAGDDAIVYPDPKNDGVFVSTRLEMMREGIEDYELLRAASDRGRAEALAKQVMPGFTSYVRDVNRFRQFQRELLTIASQGQSPSAR